ncbi:MAG: MFS transporter [Thermoprotei archaeon]
MKLSQKLPKWVAVNYALIVYTVIRGFGIACFMFLIPLYILSLGYSTADIGDISTLGALPVFALIPLIGYLVDKGYAPIVLSGSTILLGIALINPTILPTYPILVSSYTLLNLSMYMWMPSRTKLVAETVPAEKLGKTYGLFTIAFNASRTATPLILGGLTSVYGYRALLLTSGSILLLSSMILYPYIRGRGIASNSRELSLVDSYKRLFTRFGWDALPLVLFIGFDVFGWRMWFPLVNAYLKEYKRLGDPEIGLFTSVLGFSMLLTGYFAGVLTDRLTPKRALVVYELIGVVGVILLAFTEYPVVYLSASFLGFSIAFWVTAYNSLVTLVYGYESIGRVRALTDTTRSIVGIPAPKMGGYLLTLNPVLPFTVSIVFMLLAIIPVSLVKIRGGLVPREEREPEI